MSTSISNLNPKTTILDTTTIKKNLSYLTKFDLPSNVAQYIDIYLIFYDVHINDPITVSDIELNLLILIYLESYQVSQTLVIYKMLKVFYNEFHGWGYT